MSKPALRHHVVRFESRINVGLVNAHRHPHQHVLGPFHNFAVHFQEIRPLQGFEAEVIVLKISIINDLTVEPLCVLQGKDKGIAQKRSRESSRSPMTN